MIKQNHLKGTLPSVPFLLLLCFYQFGILFEILLREIINLLRHALINARINRCRTAL